MSRDGVVEQKLNTENKMGKVFCQAFAFGRDFHFGYLNFFLVLVFTRIPNLNILPSHKTHNRPFWAVIVVPGDI
jgi:hypothetical protein